MVKKLVRALVFFAAFCLLISCNGTANVTKNGDSSAENDEDKTDSDIAGDEDDNDPENGDLEPEAGDKLVAALLALRI